MRRQFCVALRLTAVELIRNRFALLLLMVYLPAWYGVIYGLSDDAPVGFRLRAVGAYVATDQHHLGLLTGMLNATTLIIGFAALSAVRRSALVDRRLVLCGYSRAALFLGRLLAFAAASVCIALYAVAVLGVFTPPRHPGVVVLGTVGAALTYAGVGALAGVAARGDLEAFFAVIMLSLVDTFLQNPVGNPAGNRAIVEYFPSYFPMQIIVGGAIDDHLVWGQVWGSAGWAAALAALGTLAFWRRTRIARAAD